MLKQLLFCSVFPGVRFMGIGGIRDNGFSKQRFYLIGSDRSKRFFRVLKIDRSEPSDLNISEDPVVYSSQEIKNLLQRIAEGNRATGGLTFVAKVFGIAG